MSAIKIKSTHPESQGDFVLIDEENFDKNIHQLYEDTESLAKRPYRKSDPIVKDDK